MAENKGKFYMTNQLPILQVSRISETRTRLFLRMQLRI